MYLVYSNPQDSFATRSSRSRKPSSYLSRSRPKNNLKLKNCIINSLHRCQTDQQINHTDYISLTNYLLISSSNSSPLDLRQQIQHKIVINKILNNTKPVIPDATDIIMISIFVSLLLLVVGHVPL